MSDSLSDYRRSRMPNENQKSFGWTIFRAKPGKQTKLLILSDDIFGIETHWWNQRTGPCREHGCEACLAGHESRWKGYLLCFDMATEQHVVLEFTPPPAETLDAARMNHGSLRGLVVNVGRAKATFNGKVTIEIKQKTTIPPSKHEVFGVWDVLCKIWKLKSSVNPKRFKGDDDDHMILGEPA